MGSGLACKGSYWASYASTRFLKSSKAASLSAPRYGDTADLVSGWEDPLTKKTLPFLKKKDGMELYNQGNL